MITEEEYLKGRHLKEPLNATQVSNMHLLLERVNALLMEPDCPGYFGVTSGYRPSSINSSVGGSKRSAHLTCEAVDLADSAGILDTWLLKNPELLIKHGLYMESPSKTPGWSHLQTRAPKSGNRVFLP